MRFQNTSGHIKPIWEFWETSSDLQKFFFKNPDRVTHRRDAFSLSQPNFRSSSICQVVLWLLKNLLLWQNIGGGKHRDWMVETEISDKCNLTFQPCLTFELVFTSESISGGNNEAFSLPGK